MNEIKDPRASELLCTGEYRNVPENELICGEHCCLFYKVEASTGWRWCRLPGDGSSVLDIPPLLSTPERMVKLEKLGRGCRGVKRLPKCFRLKPISPETEQALGITNSDLIDYNERVLELK